MRIIEIDDVKYQVLKKLASDNPEHIEKMKELYTGREDMVLIRKTQEPNAWVDHPDPSYMICRRIDDADYEEITDQG